MISCIKKYGSRFYCISLIKWKGEATTKLEVDLNDFLIHQIYRGNERGVRYLSWVGTKYTLVYKVSKVYLNLNIINIINYLMLTCHTVNTCILFNSAYHFIVKIYYQTSLWFKSMQKVEYSVLLITRKLLFSHKSCILYIKCTVYLIVYHTYYVYHYISGNIMKV